MSSLTPKQEKFCQVYIETGNASEAYRRSYDAKNMKPESINRKAKELLDNGKISARIKELQEKHLQRHNVSVDRVLREYSRIAFLDIRKAFNEDGNLKPIQEMDDDTVAAISGLDVEELFEGKGAERKYIGNLHKIKLADKKGALDSIARHLGMFVDKAEITGKDGGAIEITNAKAALLRGIVSDTTS